MTSSGIGDAKRTSDYDAALERDGVKVSRSPWGPEDEIGRLNWLESGAAEAVLNRLNGRKVFDLAVSYFSGMPSWSEAGDPRFDIWMTHTPGGTIVDGASGYSSEIHEKYSYCGDAISMYSHCGTHIDSLNHFGYYETFWNGWTTDEFLGSKAWIKGGTAHYPPIMARGVLLDVAGMLGVECLEESYGITPKDIQDTIKRQQVTVESGDVVLVRTGQMTLWPDGSRYLPNSPGITLASAKWLCESAGVMCIAADNIGLEVMPYEDAYAPVHCYMFATAGAQIMEVVQMEEIAAERQWEFAFLGFPMKIHGATGAPMPCAAVPLK